MGVHLVGSVENIVLAFYEKNFYVSCLFYETCFSYIVATSHGSYCNKHITQSTSSAPMLLHPPYTPQYCMQLVVFFYISPLIVLHTMVNASLFARRTPLRLLAACTLAFWALASLSTTLNAQKRSAPLAPSLLAYLQAERAFEQANRSTTGYTLRLPGKRQPDGSYSLARVITVERVGKENYLPNRVIVKTKQHFVLGKRDAAFQSSALMSSLEGYGIRSIRAAAPEYNNGRRVASDEFGLGRVYEIRYTAPVDVFDVCRALNENPEIEYAEPVYIQKLLQASPAPNDSLFGAQYMWQRIQLQRAWDVVKGDSTIVIAVVDSGVDVLHEDLAANIWTNPGESGTDAQGRDKRSNGVDDDGNGKIDDWRGWDFVGNITFEEALDDLYREDNNPRPEGVRNVDADQAHGTHVAGLFGAVVGNGKGTAGSSHNCRILAIKCGSENDAISRSVLRSNDGILYAAQMGAHVINCSFGGVQGFSAYTQEVINTATALGSIIVAAAGNGTATGDNDVMDNRFYPASYDNVLSVGNCEVNDMVWSPANGHGSGTTWGVKTTVFTPGVQAPSTVLYNRYANFTGTSMSSPATAGVVALVRKLHPDWSARQIIQQIRSTSDNAFTIGPLGASGTNSERNPLTFGRLNAFKAVTMNRQFNEGTDVVPGITFTNAFITAPGGSMTSYQPARLVLSVQNVLSNASNVRITLESRDGRGTVLTPTRSVGDLATLEQKTAIFDIQLSPAAIASGSANFLVTYRATSPSGSYINYELVTVGFSIPFARQPQLVVSSNLDFGSVLQNSTAATRSVQFRNLGNQTITVSTATFTNNAAGEFAFERPFTPLTLAAGQTSTLPVRFAPSTGATAGARQAAVSFTAISDGRPSAGGVIGGNYNFESIVGQYNEFTDGTVLGAGASVDDAEYTIDVPFPVRFGTRSYTSVRISSNGFLAFNVQGSLVPQGANPIFFPIANDGGVRYDGTIAAFATDLQLLSNGDIRWKVEGQSPNRTLVVQFRNVSFYENPGPNTPRTDANMNFQFRIAESTGRIELAYGRMSFTGTPTTNFQGVGQIGLRGADISDFNVRRIAPSLGNNWISSVEGTATQLSFLTSTLFPPVGLTYRWDYSEPELRSFSFARSTELRGEIRTGAFVSSSISTLSFGTVTTGTTRILPVTIRNTGTADLVVSRMTIATGAVVDASEFTVLDSLTAPIRPGDSARVRVQFAAGSTNPRARPATLRIESNAPTFFIPMLGRAGDPPPGTARVLAVGFRGQADFDIQVRSFLASRFDRAGPFVPGQPLPPVSYLRVGEVRTATDIEYRNRGTEPVTINGFDLSGTGASEFAITSPTQFPVTLRPNDSLRLTVRYAPLVPGEKIVRVTVRSNAQRAQELFFTSLAALPRFITVTPRSFADLVPVGSDGEPRELFVQQFDQTDIGSTRASVVLLQHATSASAPATITGVRLSGANAGDFRIDAASLAKFPITLRPGMTETLTLRFSPTALGDREAQLTLTAQGTPAEESIMLQGRARPRQRLGYDKFAFVFQPVAVGDSSTSQELIIQNIAPTPVTFPANAARIVGRDSAEFRLEFSSRAITLPEDSIVRGTVRFFPRSLGPKEARLVIQSSAELISLELRGRGITQTSATLQVGEARTAPGGTVEIPVFLTNRRNVQPNTVVYADVRFNATLLEPLDSLSRGTVVDGQRIVPLTLNTGDGRDSVLARLRYRAALGSDTATALTLGSGSSALGITARSGRFALTSVPTANFQQLRYDQIQRGEISVPIVFTNRRNIPAGSTMTTTLQYNASLLRPLDNLAQSSVSGGVRTITFTIPPGTSDSTVTLRFTAMVGNDTATNLSLRNRFATGLTLTPQPARFGLLGLNRAGGTQLYLTPTTLLAVVRTTPNPASDAISLTFDVLSASPLTLTMTDIYGNIVKTLDLGTFQAGRHTVETPLGELASGTYFLTLRSLTDAATERLQIVR